LDVVRLEAVLRFAPLRAAGLLAVRPAGLLAAREGDDFVVVLLAVLRDEVFAALELAPLEERPEDRFAVDTEERSFSRSLITARLVFAASRRTAFSASATSL